MGSKPAKSLRWEENSSSACSWFLALALHVWTACSWAPWNDLGRKGPQGSSSSNPCHKQGCQLLDQVAGAPSNLVSQHASQLPTSRNHRAQYHVSTTLIATPNQDCYQVNKGIWHKAVTSWPSCSVEGTVHSTAPSCASQILSAPTNHQLFTMQRILKKLLLQHHSDTKTIARHDQKFNTGPLLCSYFLLRNLSFFVSLAQIPAQSPFWNPVLGQPSSF